MSQMKKKIYTGFGWTSLYTVVFGRFPRPKKCHLWPKKWIFVIFFSIKVFLKIFKSGFY